MKIRVPRRFRTDSPATLKTDLEQLADAISSRLTDLSGDDTELTLIPGSAVSIDALKSTHFVLYLSANTTLALPDPGTARRFRVRFIQDTTVRSIVLPSGVKTPGGAGVVLNATAGSEVIYEFDRIAANDWRAYPLAPAGTSWN